MIPSILTAFVALFACYAWFVLDVAPAGNDSPELIVVESSEKHTVTPEMLAASEKMAQTTAPGFRAEATDGKSYDLAELTKNGPVVLAFIKDGCPCSVEAQLYYNRLFEAYGAHMPFFGVIDSPVVQAQTWGTENHAAFPLLSDVELKIVHDYKAESSAFLALVSKGGTLEKLWPGYSIDMLNEASAQLARIADVEPQPIDTTGAPVDMYTGCPF